MVIHNHSPYWAMTSEPTAEPGAESLDCTDWNIVSTLHWIGLGGSPQTDCTWQGGTDSNFRGADNISFESFGSANSEQVMVEGSDSSVSLILGQGVTLTTLEIYVSVNSGHQEHSGTWAFDLIIDGIANDTACSLGGRQSDPRGGSGLVLYCSSDINLYVAANSTISIGSLWNADRHNNDQVLSNIDWVLNYSLGAR